MSEILTDRFTLTNGFQVLRDELQFAGIIKTREHQSKLSQISLAGANLRIPSVVSTQAYTNCGDRFNSEFHTQYQLAVSSRFATISETGSLKTEAFFPTGGGTDDGKTFAHVTVAHMLNDGLKKAIYEGNPSSFCLINFDIYTHCGKSTPGNQLLIGIAGESCWRDRRAACGAIVGCLKAYNNNNPVHRRLRSDLGETNFQLLSTNKIYLDDGVTYINYLIAAAIVSIQGMINTAKACLTEMDERGVAHLTANCALNKKSSHEGLFSLYFGRMTVFQNEIKIQSFGTNGSKYSGVLVQVGNAKRIQLFYDGKVDIPILDLAEFESQNVH